MLQRLLLFVASLMLLGVCTKAAAATFLFHVDFCVFETNIHASYASSQFTARAEARNVFTARGVRSYRTYFTETHRPGRHDVYTYYCLVDTRHIPIVGDALPVTQAAMINQLVARGAQDIHIIGVQVFD